MDPLDVVLDGFLPPQLSAITAALMCGVFPLILGGVALVRTILASRQLRAEKLAFDLASPLAEGPIVLYGPIELATGQDVAVRITLTQLGTERSGQKGHKTHVWRETERVTTARPFYVRDVRGQRVRVEPPPDIRCHDSIERTERIDYVTRAKIAELAAGEVVHVRGELVRAPDPEAAGDYRGGANALVLRAPPRGKMAISSLGLGSIQEDELAHWRGAAIIYAVLFAVSLAACAPMLTRAASGERSTAEVVSKRAWTTQRKGNTYHHYAVTFRLPSGETDEWKVAGADHARVNGGDRVAAMVARWPGGEAVEPAPTLHIAAGAVGLILWSGSALLLRKRKKLLVEKGSGPLGE